MELPNKELITISTIREYLINHIHKGEKRYYTTYKEMIEICELEEFI